MILPADIFETQVNTLAAFTFNNDVAISNTGALDINDVVGVVGVASVNGKVNVTASSPLTVSSDVVAGDSVVLTAADSAGAGDDLTVNAGAKVQSLGAEVALLAGDNVNVSPTASVISDTSYIYISIDHLDADTGTGGVANLNGTLDAATNIDVTGASDDDQVIIDGNGGALNDGGTVDGISGLFTFYGNAGADELIVDDSGDNTGDNILIQNTGVGVGSVIGAGAVSLSYDALEDLTLYSGTDADDITVNPNVLTTIDIVGGDPAAPTSPGDTLTYLTPPGESSTFTPSGLDGGTISATGGYQDVTFDEIEGLTFGGSIVVDGTAGDDTLTITALTANSGTYQINGGPVINFNANTDFTFNGLNGDDTLIINNPAGGLFDPVNGITFNGGTGGETLGDTLQILGGTAATVEHQFVDNHNGSVFFNGEGTATITYTGLEPIDDTITATDRIFTFTGAAETITLSDDGGPGDGLSLIDSDLGESVNFVHPLATLTINTELSGGSGSDAINIDPLDSTFTANLTVNAGNDDVINTGTVDIGAGALDLTAGQVFVNGAFTTTGSVDIDSTFADITFAAAGSIDAGASDIDLTAFFNVESLNVTTTSEVRVTATSGGINDLTGNALITADRAALRVGGPGGITGIDTNVNTLATSVAGGAFTIDNTGALEIGTVDGLAGITAAASSIFLTTTGTLLVSDTVTGGAVDLRSNDTMTISDNVSASTGTLKLQNFGGDFVLNSPAQISNAAAFLIDIDSAGAVTLADGSLVTSLGTGLIDIDAVNNIALANVNTGGEAQITTSAGAITDNTGTEAALITADTVALRAATGIGAAGAGDIDLAVGTIAADTTTGDIYLQEPSAATVGTVDGLAGITTAGNISLEIGGTLNVNDAIEATGAASTILVEGQGDVNVSSTVQTNGGAIDLLADNSLVLGPASVVDTTSAAVVTLTADADSLGGGDFTQFEGSLVNAQGGDLDVSSTGSASIADLRSVGGTVSVTSTSGGIIDNTVAETALITADEAALSALAGIDAGVGGNIETAVGTLAAFTTNNDVVISNTGALIIGDVAPLSGVTSTNGVVTISASSPLTVSSNVTGAGTVSLTATDSAVAGDDLTIDPGVTVESTGADVVLTAGDDFTMDATSQINAATTIGIFVDPSVGDPDAVGGTVDLVGGISAPGGTTVTGGDDDDTFNILPSSTSTIAVVGGDPTLPAVPGDTLNIDLSGVTDPALVLGGAPGSGTFNFLAPDTELPVSYSSIEDVNTLAGAYHLVLDMLFSGFEDASDDTIDVGLDAGGTNLLIDINGSNFFTGADADILSFTVLGSDDDDTLNINETAGGLPFFATAAPAGIPGSNGAHLNLAAETFLEGEFPPTDYDVNDITIHYDGKNGADAINVNFITDHNAGYFSDVIDGLGSGNIGAAAVGDTDIDLGLSFANIEGVGLSGSGTGGGLRVDASSTPDTTGININDAGGAGDGVSQITGNGGFTALLFEDFTDLQVISGTGAELIDLIALDSATTLTNVELDADDVFAADDVSNDTIRIRSTPAGVTSVSLLGGLGDDLFQIFDAGSTVDNIFAALDVDGEGGNDTLNIVDSGDVTGDTFEVTSTTVDGISSSAGTDVTYANIDDLNITGTDGDDTINVNLGLQEDLDTVTINGAGGDDDFNLQNSTPSLVNTVLNGQAGNDEFFFDSNYVLRGFINGGGDIDTIDYTTYSNAVHVQLAGLGSLDGFQGYELNGSILGTGGGGTGFDNINDLVGSANSDTLEGPNLNNYWGVTSTDEGFIIAERNNLASGRPTIAGDAIATPPEERLDFTDFQNLIGGTQDDRFDLSDGAGLTGTLDGDTGNDSLDYRDYTTGVTVDLFAGTATNINGGLVAGTGGGDDDNSIENVFGGDGNDDITGDNDNNILGDGLGSDNLDGGGYGVGSGNGGNDVFLMEPGAGGSVDVITDIHGNDTVDFRFASQGIVFDVDIINTPQDVFGGNTVELRQLQPEQPDTNPSFMENVVGSEFDDYIFIDPLSQDGNFPIDGPPVLRSADGRGGFDILDFDAKGQAVIDTGYSLTADGVGTVQYLNFEEVTPFEDNPATIVDNGDLGFSLSGDWPYHPAGTAAITTGVGYADDIHTVQSQLVDPVHYGDAAAFWEFYGLTPGVYRVSVTWPASENPFVIPQMASDAPFTVFDGSRNDITTTAINLGTFDLNQQIAPDDFLADGALWEDLGTFTVNSRTLTVMLTNLANGLITADAVRIERVSAGPEVQLTDVTDAPAPPSILVDGHPGGIDFGTTELLTDLTRTFEITNTGSAALDISNIVIPAGFTTTLVAQSVAAGDTISFEITMDSDSFGDRSGLFSFDTNDVDEATFNLLLHGQVSNVVIIDNGDADFSATAGFELYDSGVNRGSAGFEGDIAGAIPNQPGFIPPPAGTDTATWTFTGLADGFYRVSTTWSALYNRVTDAPYSLDGGAGTFDIDVNQTLIPSTFADNGAAWFDLNTSFEVVGGTLTVTLTNDASSIPRDTFDLANGVIADAVRIEYLPTPDLEVTVDGNVVDDDTGVVDFGTTIPGIPVSKTFTVTNLSADPVDVTGLIEFPPGFSIDPASPFGTDTVPVNIPGGGSVTFTIQFDGGTTGSTFGQISFTTGDADENPYNFTVTGAAGPATVGINDATFDATGAWNEHIPGVVGDPEFLYTGVPYVGGTGTSRAFWDFDVEPGRYQVVAHWYVHPDVSPYGRAAATNAPYTIFSDATPVATYRVSHQGSSNDFLDDGTWWEYIGDPVVINDNHMTVVLSDDANGIVYADEIRIIRVVDPVIKVEVDGGTVEDSGAVDFEDTIIGAPVVKTFTVTNFGERNMALGPINVPTGFSLVSGFGDTNLAPGDSTTFTLQMDASIGGSFSGMVSFGGDLAVENPFNFTVSGSAADSMIIDNGDFGYSTSGAAWNREVRTWGDDTQYFQRDQDVLLGGDLPGTNTATWTFENLGAGTYQVASHWLNHSGYASNAQITIAGIEGGPITVTLDQRFYPQGFSADGSIWQELGNFQVAAGNTLTVTISDDGANGNLAADAMRLELIPPGLTAPEIDVAAGTTALTSGVSSIDLGTAFFGETLSQTFTVTNTGTNTLNLGAITLPGLGEYTVSSGPGTTTLFAGQSTTFEISFNSTGAAGVVAGPVSIVTNDSDENPFTFNITAEMTDVVLIDNGDVGYSSTGSWNTLFYDARYFESDAQRLNLGQSGTATWDFTNLTAGTYTVSATWLNDPLRATNAEYNVAGVGPVVVNQRIAPNDFAADGFNWEILTAAVVVTPGGSITVTLSDNGPADGAINADAIRIQRVGPLMAAAGVSSTAAPSITQSDLDSVVDAALSYWETAGLSDAQLELLSSVNFVLTDLPDAMLGGASGTTVLIDINAAGYGWFVDGTPLDSSEFTLLDGSLLAGSGSDAFGQMDLLTVVMHELGHTLGLEDLDSDGTLMSESLDVSERRLPSADELDDFFSGIAGGDNPLLD
ncbi:choice-of-anchor D domain-containing protein [Gimesia benthica]|uniref:Choice-of-anchor D domain-containing protein n=1 Tax=Gimesia benthica TaxID=2608982 RepID=A0A6I6A970_9PLAN|nr:choice-of-anchor D domain-containing protein [Gimesia benthica]